MRVAVALVSACSLTACASTPDMTVHYFLPRVDLDMKVTKSLACDADNNIMQVVSGTPTASYSADGSLSRSIEISRVDGFFSDADLTFDFKDDGRLSGVNVETAGQAEEIVKTAMTVLQPILGAVGLTEARGITPKEACEKIAAWGGQNKTISLTYVGTMRFADQAGTAAFALEPDASSIFYDSQLAPLIGSVCASAGKSLVRQAMGVQPGTKGDVRLQLKQPAISDVQVRNFAKPKCDGGSAIVWQSFVPVPQHGDDYDVLIPRAAAFGKQTFTMTLSDAGTVKQLKYGKINGVKQALNAANTAINTVNPSPTDRTKAANDRMAEIAAQEKLARCLADHSKCGG